MDGLVVIEVRALSAPSGGVARYVRGLLSGLSLVRPDLPLVLIGDSQRRLREDPVAGRLPGLGVGPAAPLLRLGWDFWSLPHAVRQLRPVLLHRTKPAGNPPLSGLPPTIVTVYDTIPLEYPETQTFLQRTYWRLQLPLAVRHTAHILTISEASRNAIIDRFGVSPSRVTVTTPGIDGAFRPVPETEVTIVKDRYGLQRPYVLTVGTIEPRKNIDRLLAAFACLTDGVPHDLVIAGRWGWKTDAVHRAADDPRIRGRAHFLGSVPDEVLPSLYTGADAFVFLSRAEGFGFPPLEAMACGVPVVASRLGSLPEVVGDGGILVNPADEPAVVAALRELLTDPRLRADLRARGLRRAQTFTWEKMAQQTLGVYEQVVAAHAGTRRIISP